jgi:opacity protein-like surface antigen
MKRTIGILGGIAFLLLANTAQAEPMEVDGGMYWSVGGGVSFVENETTILWGAGGCCPAQTDERFLELNPGWVGRAAIGYTMAYPELAGDLRFELEATHRDYTDGQTNSEWSFSGHGVAEIEGTIKIDSAMFNIYTDFHTQTRFVPYLGVGVGYSRIDIDVDERNVAMFLMGAPFPLSIDEETYSLSWQVMLGVGYRLSPGTVIELEYRSFSLVSNRYLFLFRTDDLDDIEFDDFLLSIRYTF